MLMSAALGKYDAERWNEKQERGEREVSEPAHRSLNTRNSLTWRKEVATMPPQKNHAIVITPSGI